MSGLLLGGIIGEGLKSFVNSYNAAQDRMRQQAEADEDRAQRRRQTKLTEKKEGLIWDESKQDYSFESGNGSIQQKRRTDAIQKDLDNVRNMYNSLTEDQKLGTKEGVEMRNTMMALQNRLSQELKNTYGDSGAPAAQADSTQGMIQAPATPPTGGMLPNQPVKKSVAPSKPIASRPQAAFGGMAALPGYKSKDDRAVEKAVQLEVAKKTALSQLPPETRLATESAESKQKIALLKDGYGALTPYINAVNSGERKRYVDPKTPFVGQFVSSKPIDEAQIMMTEAIGRLHSGGAINDEELVTFKGLVPSAADDDEAIERKLNQFQALMRSKLQTFGYTPEQLGLSAPPVINLKKKEAVSAPKASPQTAAPTKPATNTKTAHPPGSIITLRDGSVVKVADDGDTLIPVR